MYNEETNSFLTRLGDNKIIHALQKNYEPEAYGFKRIIFIFLLNFETYIFFFFLRILIPRTNVISPFSLSLVH